MFLPRLVHLRLESLWHKEGRCFAAWSPLSRNFLSEALNLLHDQLNPVLSPLFIHIKGHGEVKGTVRDLKKAAGDFQFVARFNIASYYDSMQHLPLLELLRKVGVDETCLDIVHQYLTLPVQHDTGNGMVAGGALLPLLGALYLQPVDIVMQKMVTKGKIYYFRYMDDMVIFARTWWHLRKAVGILIKSVQSLGLAFHKNKRFINRIDRGFGSTCSDGPAGLCSHFYCN